MTIRSCNPTTSSSKLKVWSTLDLTKHKSLVEASRRYNGLCEFICNRALFDSLSDDNGSEILSKEITAETLNKKEVLKSHILSIYSACHKISAFVFGVYPDNLFSFSEQRKLKASNAKTVNRELLKRKFILLEEGDILKFHAFIRTWTTFSGHTHLIKKMTNNSYSFFDPNHEEKTKLTFDQLCDCIDRQIRVHKATDLLFMRGRTFLERMA